jgi:prolyl-tRNA editing enzyme YbaK/EbsC (Cys-tRNA(Pro) deacylase)
MSEVTDFLEARSIHFEVINHERAFTSLDEAHSLGLAADEVLKALAITSQAGDAIVVLPASRRMDQHLLEQAVRDRHARLATEPEIERTYPGYELGALPPMPTLLKVPAYVDPEVMKRETVAFAAGSTTQSVRMRREDLFEGAEITLAPLARSPDKE